MKKHIFLLIATLSGLVNSAVEIWAQDNQSQNQTLNIYCWTEYIPQSVIDAFTERTGIRVAVANYASNEEMLAKIGAGAGSYDLIQPSDYTLAMLKADGRVEKLDLSKIPNLANIAPEFRGLDFDPNNEYSVPWMAGLVGIVVNVKEVKRPVTGYTDLFKPDLKGRIICVDDPRELVTWALYTLGKDINDISPDALDAASGVLKTWMPLIRAFDSDSPKQAFLNGDVTAGVVWSGEAALLLREDPDTFKWILPSEGTHLFLDNLAIPKGAKNIEAAHRFMNFVLEPQVGKMISEEFPYTNPNLGARKLLDPADLANPASYPSAEEIKKLGMFKPIDGARAAAIDRLITDLRSR